MTYIRIGKHRLNLDAIERYEAIGTRVTLWWRNSGDNPNNRWHMTLSDKTGEIIALLDELAGIEEMVEESR